jgi:serine/threonine protein kinase
MLTLAGGAIQVKIMDFGLARSQQADSTVGSAHIMGTPSYMAPERLAEEKAQ